MDTTSIIIVAVAALLVIYAVWGTVQKIRGKAKSSCCGGKEAKPLKKVSDTDKSHYPYKYELLVENMKCSGCAVNVENAINSMDGCWGRVNLGKKTCEVLAKSQYGIEDFRDALKGTSYKVIEVKEL